MALYDYIYVDIEKVISVYSQLTGGVVELREKNLENTYTADNKRNYDFKIFKHDAGGTDQNRQEIKEVIKPHHSLLSDLEAELFRNGYLVDLTEQEQPISLRETSFRDQLKNTFCLKAKGRCVVEDYDRMKSIAESFPEVVKIIEKSRDSAIRSSSAYLDIQKQLDEAKINIKQTKDRNQKSINEEKLKNLNRLIEDLVRTNAANLNVEQWILDGYKSWVNTFLPGIVNLRVYPSLKRPDEHIFGHLKKHCFEDKESNSFHFTYGSLPTESMTMLGIITSVPTEEPDAFNPLAEFQKDELVNVESVEKAFRGLFRGFDGFEQLIRTSRYPRILVYPLTVYRCVTPNMPTKTF